jgi:ABC-2 type transport system permease protein
MSLGTAIPSPTPNELDYTQELSQPVPYEQLGRPMRGPGALSRDWSRIWHLTFNMAVMAWKQRFFGSVLGYLWQLVRPLLLFLVLYVFFTKVAHVGQGLGPSEKYAGAQLLASIVLFTFFQESTMGAVRCVVDKEGIVRKIHFPRIVIPCSQVMLSCFNLGLNLIVVFIFAIAGGVRPMTTWWEIIPILGLLIILCTGIAMLLSAGFVYFRDLEPIWEVVNQVIFYASPIILPIIEIQQHLSSTPLERTLFHLFMLNPLAVVFQQFRHAVINHATPSAGALLGSMTQLLIPIAIVLAIFALGLWVFNRVAPEVAENV